MTAKTKRASEPRRANKPLMEKRRRARINQSLAALKTLILDTAKADNTKHSKLEKADILELTVRHFQRHRSLDVKGVNHYKAGYADCVREVQRYLDTPDAQTMTIIDAGVRQRLLRHLDNCIAEVDMDIRNATLAPPPPSSQPQQPPPPPPSTEERLQPPDSSTLEEINNNHNIKEACNKEEEEVATIPAHSSQQTPPPLPCSKPIKNYDGNFVLLLPEHYFQLANVLGVNLRSQNQSGTDPGVSTVEKVEICEEMVPEKRLPAPIDFSKNNDNCDMWRPW